MVSGTPEKKSKSLITSTVYNTALYVLMRQHQQVQNHSGVKQECAPAVFQTIFSHMRIVVQYRSCFHILGIISQFTENDAVYHNGGRGPVVAVSNLVGYCAEHPLKEIKCETCSSKIKHEYRKYGEHGLALCALEMQREQNQAMCKS